MPLQRGTRPGPYQIESSIGAGGLGVYRATGTRLGQSTAWVPVMRRFSIMVVAFLGSLGALGEAHREPGTTRAAPQVIRDVAPICRAVVRLPHNPIITPATHSSIGTNISGPTVIRVPAWVSEPLGRFYLYFADHNGSYIRLAFADRMEGPWQVHPPGALDLSESYFTDHIASPEAVVDDAGRRIHLYFHGLTPEDGRQHTRVALSTDGVTFTTIERPVGDGSAYWRVFEYGNWWYALAMPGRESPVNLHRARDPLTPFEPGPQLFPTSPRQVHNAVLVRDDVMDVFYTREGDRPERILHSEVTLGPDWTTWRATSPRECLAPETDWEGADLSIEAGIVGALERPSHALRDPAIFQDDGRTYMFYAVAGESGIAVAELRAP